MVTNVTAERDLLTAVRWNFVQPNGRLRHRFLYVGIVQMSTTIFSRP